MKNAFLTIKVEPELRERVEQLAKKEHRSIADQTAYLMELGIKAMEGRFSDPSYTLLEAGPVMGAQA
jgi:predicted transcriptional regulator